MPHVNTGSNIEVSIECLDDIAFHSGGTPLELLQTKHHVDRVASLSDTSVDLWKTLRVWCEAALADPSLPSRAKLVLVTTGQIPDGSAASMLKPYEFYSDGQRRDPKRAQETLTAIATSAENRELKAAFASFLSLLPQMRASMLSAVEIIDKQPLLNDLDQVLEESLRLLASRGKAAAARELLEGWWWPRVCTALSTRPVQTIPISALETKLDDIRDALKRDALVADFENADPTAEQAAEYNAFPFVRQLEAIGVGGNRIGYAKRDYYRAFAQRSKWTREHVVLDDELERFEATLIEEWEPRFDAMCSAADRVGHDGDGARQAGQSLYLWVETEARFPFRSLTARFLSVGSYHILANNMRVGWHRDYAKLLLTEAAE